MTARVGQAFTGLIAARGHAARPAQGETDHAGFGKMLKDAPTPFRQEPASEAASTQPPWTSLADRLAGNLAEPGEARTPDIVSTERPVSKAAAGHADDVDGLDDQADSAPDDNSSGEGDPKPSGQAAPPLQDRVPLLIIALQDLHHFPASPPAAGRAEAEADGTSEGSPDHRREQQPVPVGPNASSPQESGRAQAGMVRSFDRPPAGAPTSRPVPPSEGKSAPKAAVSANQAKGAGGAQAKDAARVASTASPPTRAEPVQSGDRLVAPSESRPSLAGSIDLPREEGADPAHEIVTLRNDRGESGASPAGLKGPEMGLAAARQSPAPETASLSEQQKKSTAEPASARPGQVGEAPAVARTVASRSALAGPATILSVETADPSEEAVAAHNFKGESSALSAMTGLKRPEPVPAAVRPMLTADAAEAVTTPRWDRKDAAAAQAASLPGMTSPIHSPVPTAVDRVEEPTASASGPANDVDAVASEAPSASATPAPVTVADDREEAATVTASKNPRPKGGQAVTAKIERFEAAIGGDRQPSAATGRQSPFTSTKTLPETGEDKASAHQPKPVVSSTVSSLVGGRDETRQSARPANIVTGGTEPSVSTSPSGLKPLANPALKAPGATFETIVSFDDRKLSAAAPAPKNAKSHDGALSTSPAEAPAGIVAPREDRTGMEIAPAPSVIERHEDPAAPRLPVTPVESLNSGVIGSRNEARKPETASAPSASELHEAPAPARLPVGLAASLNSGAIDSGNEGKTPEAVPAPAVPGRHGDAASPHRQSPPIPSAVPGGIGPRDERKQPVAASAPNGARRREAVAAPARSTPSSSGIITRDERNQAMPVANRSEKRAEMAALPNVAAASADPGKAIDDRRQAVAATTAEAGHKGGVAPQPVPAAPAVAPTGKSPHGLEHQQPPAAGWAGVSQKPGGAAPAHLPASPSADVAGQQSKPSPSGEGGKIDEPALAAGPRPAVQAAQSIDAGQAPNFQAPPPHPASPTAPALAAAIASDNGVRHILLASPAPLHPARPVAVSTQVLKIELHPAELGMVTASLRLSGEQLSIELKPENHEAFRRLSSDSEAIVKSLRGLGFDVDKVTVIQPALAHPAPARADTVGPQPPSAGRDQPSFQPGNSGGDSGGSGGQPSGRNRNDNGQEFGHAIPSPRERADGDLFI